MLRNLTLVWALVFSIHSFSKGTNSDCTNAHSNASYVLFHSKKALKSDNFDHQKYYAGRAIEALEKATLDIEKCGCPKTEIPIFNTMKQLKLAYEPENWDKGRFFTKKAIANAEELIEVLSECTSDAPIDTNGAVKGKEELNAEENRIKAKQQELEARKQALLKEQENLEKEMAAQKALAAKQEADRAKELEQQKELQLKAEKALKEYQLSITKLIDVFDCSKKDKIFEEFKRDLALLKDENLIATKQYYLLKARQIANRALEELNDCRQ